MVGARVSLSRSLVSIVAFSLLACGMAGAATVVPIVFDSPLGGEVFAIGQNQTVRLDPKTKYKSVLLELSADGTHWVKMGTGTSPTGLIDNTVKDATKHNVLIWTVAGPTSANCVIRASAPGKTPAGTYFYTSPFSITSTTGAPPAA
ncbi:MAG: hypothetical protein ABSE73_31780, partial [Planctomycetota bacterium]